MRLTHAARNRTCEFVLGGHLLQITALTKTFAGKIAVDRATLRIDGPAMIGIIGRSGAGKSTLLRMLNGLTPASSGEISFQGKAVTGLKGAALRNWQAQCAMIFQQFNLVSRMDVVSNLLPNSTSGYLVPAAELQAAHGDLKAYFASVAFSGGHEQTIVGVANGDFAAGVSWADGLGNWEDGYNSGAFRRAADAGLVNMSDLVQIWKSALIPEGPLADGQILVYQVPIPEPLRFLEPGEIETRRMHGLQDDGLMHVKLYEDIARHGAIATSYDDPVKVEGRYVMDPSPIPKFDNPKLEMAAIQLFGAGREQRIYALPPPTKVVSLDFEDFPFEPSKADHSCALCAAGNSCLDEVITDDAGGRMFVCSGTDFCAGGEQQRVNIARGFVHSCPALLLDEPTASLDAKNREVVLTLIEAAKAQGAAILGIFHDQAARARVCDRLVDVADVTPGAA